MFPGILAGTVRFTEHRMETMMKWYALAFLCLTPTPLLWGQDAVEARAIIEREFPIIFEVEKSEVVRPVTNPQSLALGDSLENAPPTFGVFRGMLNQERHWRFTCWAENTRLEVTPCTDMPLGLQRARWVHNRELLEILTYDSGGNVGLRYVDVTIDPKDPPAADDPVQSLPTNPGLFAIEHKGIDYPLLVHVYGAVAMSLQVGQLPARTNCNIRTITPDRTNVNCAQYPAIPINQGYVTVDASIDGQRKRNISCDAKWRWSKCSVIGPGFYQARWKDGGHSQIVLLGLRNDHKPQEIGFEVR